MFRHNLKKCSQKSKLDIQFIFQIDDNYIGIPPPIQVTIKNLNDNINKNFLDVMLKKHGEIEHSQIFYHPKTNKHLRLAHVTFTTIHAAKMCVEKLNRTTVMGDVLSVYLDPFGMLFVCYCI